MSKYGHIVKTDVELKPCPFCGGKGVLVLIDHRYYVMCDTCTCRTASGYIGFRYYGDAEAEAIAAWNTRAERTCKVNREVDDDWEYPMTWIYELSCGHSYESIVRDAPKYCSECGAKVMEE